MRKRYIKEFSTVSDYNTFKTSASYYSPNVSYISNTDVILYNPTIIYPQIPLLRNVKNYLSFVAQASGTFQFSSAVDYSIDNGITWSTLASNTASPTVAAGSKIMWKATLTPTSSGIGTFSSTVNFIVQGNVMSLLYGDNFSGQLDLTGKDYAFKDLFTGCTGITNAYKLSLPATTLSEGCYKNMFKNCTGMVIAPILLAVTLEDSCYSNMFYGCTSLVEAPELFAATLTDNCYEYMFYGCSSLTDIKCLATDITATDCTTNWVNGVASSGTFVKYSTMSSWTAGNDGIPTNWTVDGYQDDYSSEYLTFEVLEPGVFKFTGDFGNVDYSIDNGTTWTTLTSNDYTETLNTGTIVIWRGSLTTTGNTAKGIGKFYSSGSFNVMGNALSLVYNDNFSQYNALPICTTSGGDNYAIFNNLFKDCTKLIRSDKLSLPTSISYACYWAMFQNCTSLITPPKLPATTLYGLCYYSMFKNCSSLKIAPNLPATILNGSCYGSMFEGCTSLTTPPELPATTLATSCYSYMFKGCTSLLTAPELPATTLYATCYGNMFEGCTSLTIGPDLLATTASTNIGGTYSGSYHSYREMFKDCTNLRYVKCLLRDSENSIEIYNWMLYTASNGTFVKAVGQSWATGSSGIKSSWTVLEE